MQVFNECGSDSLCDSVRLTKTGISSWAANNGIRLFPNPTSGSFILTINPTLFDSPIHLNLFNTTGTTLYQTTIHSATTSWHKKFSMNEASPGLYFVKITTPQQTITRKLMIHQ